MPKQIDTQAMTQEILVQAMQLFAQKGYQGLSMRQLAAALGMTTGVLYHYFRNKDALYTQMLQNLARHDAELLKVRAADAQTPEDALQALIGFLTSRSDYFRQILLLVFDHHRLVTDPQTDYEPEFLRVFEQPLAIYQDTLQAVLKLEKPAQARLVLDYLMGCFTRAMLYRKAPDFSELPQMIAVLHSKQKEVI